MYQQISENIIIILLLKRRRRPRLDQHSRARPLATHMRAAKEPHLVTKRDPERESTRASGECVPPPTYMV